MATFHSRLMLEAETPSTAVISSVARMLKPDSDKLVHGDLTLGGHRFFVCDEFPASEVRIVNQEGNTHTRSSEHLR